jgi:hypothetical protein
MKKPKNDYSSRVSDDFFCRNSMASQKSDEESEGMMSLNPNERSIENFDFFGKNSGKITALKETEESLSLLGKRKKRNRSAFNIFVQNYVICFLIVVLKI